MTRTVRFGVLGAARITPGALIEPARRLDRAEVTAVAARDVDRARAFAAANGIPNTCDSYGALIESTDIDAVYIALPPSAHLTWVLAALEAGKHVLCEKPFALSAAQAQTMVDTANTTGLVLAEAFHWRYHPLANRMREVLRTGRLGSLVSIDADFSAAIPNPDDIRHQLALGGGSLMDLGCYAVQWARFVADGEPEVIGATASEGRPGIDLSMKATLRFPAGITATVHCSMEPDITTRATLRVVGTAGEMDVTNPLAPHLGHTLVVRDSSATTSEVVSGRTTYDHQLEAFVAAVLDRAWLPTGGTDAVATMRVIDACYASAGLPIRGGVGEGHG